MTQATRTQHHLITLDAPGEYNVRRATDSTIVAGPFGSATEAAIEATLIEWACSQSVTVGKLND